MDIEGLLKSLNAHDVRYVVIGAFAFPIHGYARATLDVDIFFDPDAANARRTLNALKDFGYDVADLTVEELRTKKILLRQYSVEADFHPFVKGVSFEEVWGDRVEESFRGTPTHFASLRNLIRMKEAAGRPKDAEDLRYLRELERRGR